MRPGDIYACTKGTYIGSNLVFMESHDDECGFLNLPDMVNMKISTADVKSGLDSGVLELLESLPDDIIHICEKQYEKNSNSRQ
jgi:hypothetical protein